MRRSQVQRERVPERGRVVVLRALPGLGDFLCAIPALRAIRIARPDIELHLVGLPGTEPLAARFGAYIDRFEPFPGFPGLPDRRPDIRQLPGFLAAMQSGEFDLAIQMHGSGELTNAIVALFGARRIAGFYPPTAQAPDRELFLPWSERSSEVRQMLRLVSRLGWPSKDETLEFPVHAIGEAEAIATLGSEMLSRPYVVIHPGASVASRRWSVAAFAEVGNALAATGHHVLITGTAAERAITAAVVRAMRKPAIDVAGRTTLDGLAALLRGAAVLVCNDTGVSHLAAALHVPSVVVFTNSSVDRWAPLDRRLHRAVTGSAADVVEQAQWLLARSDRHAA